VAAVIDIGSNSVLLLTVAVDAAGRARALDEACVTTRLGAGLRPGGALDASARARTVRTVADFAQRARATGARPVWAFGTAAVREAKDGAAFVEELATASRIEVAILAGEDEARLAFDAVAHGLGGGQGALLVADVGGRTTELTLGTAGAVAAAVSLPLGALALTEAHLRADPPAPEALARMVAEVDAVLRASDLLGRARGTSLAACGGTATALAALDLGLGTYAPARVHGHRLDATGLATRRAALAAMPLAARAGLPGLDAGRAAILPAGAVILERLVAVAGIAGLRVSDHGVRHAYLRARLAEQGVRADLGTLWA
jgi:exopolyphosphatase/guanosine-5'-triphosphate,3'-diphosphate pyrophosphatase